MPRVSVVIAGQTSFVVDFWRMKALSFILVLGLSAAALPVQSPSPSEDLAGAHSSDLGFSYSVPHDWEVVTAPPTLDEKKSEASQNAASDEEKQGLACLEPVLTARDRKSGSILSVEALPFACFGHEMTNDDLPGFAAGAPEVLKQSFNLDKPVVATYALGTHSMWIERAHASLKDHPEISFTVEIACGLLKKAAVCWLAVAGDEDALHAFERAAVILDGETLSALVPPTAFDKKPS
jgi:hypothetical protein